MSKFPIDKIAEYANDVAIALAAIDKLVGGSGVIHTADEAVQGIAAVLEALAKSSSKPVTAAARDASIARIRDALAKDDDMADASLASRFPDGDP